MAGSILESRDMRGKTSNGWGGLMVTNQRRVQDQLIAIRNAGQTAKRHITILGAGISGLVAAYELTRLGHCVEVLEASDRIGGRIWTHYFGTGPDAPHGELGAMRIPSNHEHVLHYIEEMGLTDRLRHFKTVFSNDNCFLDVGGQICKVKERCEKLYPHYRLPKGFQCRHHLTRLVACALKSTVDAVSPPLLRALFDRELKTHLLEEIDQLFVDGLIDEHILDSDIPALVSACRLKGRWSESVDAFLRDIVLETSTELRTLDGGMEQLPRGLADRLRGHIRKNVEVREIEVQDDRVILRLKEQDGLHIKVCDCVLCTIPFPVMRTMCLKGFSEGKLGAIDGLSYPDASKVLLLCRERFWEGRKYGIFGGASVSDQVIRQVYYPLPCEQGQTDSHADTRQPGVLLGSYAIGKDAESLSGLEPCQRVSLVQDKISRFHPEINEPGMILDHATISWEQYPWTRGACCANWKNENCTQDRYFGQIDGERLKTLYRNTAKNEGRLFFAGEHCSTEQAWIEGAVTSSLGAIREIVSLPTSPGSG